MNDEKFVTVKDDSVECYFYPNCEEFHGKDFLKSLEDTIKENIKRLSQNYIWHKETFDVKINTLELEANEKAIPFFHSITYYGDNIGDEWFIVYIVRELTKMIPGLIAKVVDNDGQFLLIEAADDLPAWANPETCENRVFIMNGDLHIIQPSLLPTNGNDNISDMVKLLRTNPEKTLASNEIKQHIDKRIDVYPQKILENIHKAHIYVPDKIAALLKRQPDLISAAVNAYCGRDYIDSKVCRILKVFPLENCVNVCATFTKCLYAMLMHSKFKVPVSGTKWKMPPINTPEHKAYMLGLKVTCGFEILMSRASSDDIEKDKNWHRYCENLKEKGYFKSNLEGSEEYMQLLDKAKSFYSETELSNTIPYVGNQVAKILKESNFTNIISEIQSGTEPLEGESSDSWLDVKPEELDDMLQERYGKKSTFSKSSDVSPDTLTSRIYTFLNQQTDIEGVEFSESQNHNENTENVNNDKIDFDPDQFCNVLKNILDLDIPEDDWNLDSGTDLSEYGSENEMDGEIGGCHGMKNINKDYFAKMEEELDDTTIPKSFVRPKNGTVDVPNNTYSHMMQSCKEEMGGTGPSSNLLGLIGVPKATMEDLDSDDDFD